MSTNESTTPGVDRTAPILSGTAADVLTLLGCVS